MYKKLIIFISALLVISLPYFSFAQNEFNEKMIEFGWDYPSFNLLKNNITSLEKMPFDVVVFSFDFGIYNAFDTAQLADSKFQFNDLSNIQ